jgi:membrane-associated protease RseP (regulator of RpoE activity)
MRRLLELIVSLCLLLALAVPAPAVAPPAGFTGPVVIPIEVVPSGHIAIMAKINGKGPYRFIFDTGAPALVIGEQVSKLSGILPTPFHRPFFTMLGNLGEYAVKSIVLGRAEQKGLVTDVWNHPTVDLLSRAYGPFEGLIGFPFFAHYCVTIDYKAKTMTLTPSKYQPEDTKEKMTRHLNGDSGPMPILAADESLGVRMTKDAKDDTAGVTISAVLPDSPAADAGLKPGDRLLTLGGRWTDTVQDCYLAATAIESARPVAVTYQRDGKQHKTTVFVKPGI